MAELKIQGLMKSKKKITLEQNPQDKYLKRPSK
jgi:hypothetical protein